MPQFLAHKKKYRKGEKATPNKKSFVEVRRQKLKATTISEGQMEDNLFSVQEFTKKLYI